MYSLPPTDLHRDGACFFPLPILRDVCAEVVNDRAQRRVAKDIDIDASIQRITESHLYLHGDCIEADLFHVAHERTTVRSWRPMYSNITGGMASLSSRLSIQSMPIAFSPSLL